MAKYRRFLTKTEQKDVIDKYKNHCDAAGGIFSSDKRRKLIGLKKKNPKLVDEGTADFWYDVRNAVRHALTDLQLISEVAHSEQLKEMFQLVSSADLLKDKSKTSVANLLDSIFMEHNRLVAVRQKDQTMFLERTTDKDDSWKADLAAETVGKCLKFYMDSGLITSKAHKRLVEEVTDMLGSEYSHAVSRELSLRHFAQFR